MQTKNGITKSSAFRNVLVGLYGEKIVTKAETMSKPTATTRMRKQVLANRRAAGI